MQVKTFVRSVLAGPERLAAGSRAAGIPSSGSTSTTTCAPPSR
jgi:hypothetical protein